MDPLSLNGRLIGGFWRLSPPIASSRSRLVSFPGSGFRQLVAGETQGPTIVATGRLLGSRSGLDDEAAYLGELMGQEVRLVWRGRTRRRLVLDTPSVGPPTAFDGGLSSLCTLRFSSLDSLQEAS